MAFRKRNVRASDIALALLLAVALLFAQWAGLAHRIVHAELMEAHPYAAVQVDIDGDGKADHHSCAAFDAATVADTIHLPPFIAPLVSSVRVLALWTAFLSWDAPFSLCFSSRAPPPA
jgi:hypothetical protein